MKINRYKKVTKRIQFYMNNFNFRVPYQLLVDGTFCLAALNNQINIQDNMPRYLQGELKILSTQCAVIEMEKLGKPVSGALMILKQYPVHKCGHEKRPVTGAKCLLSMLGTHNENHYIIATQDRDLQNKVRMIPGVPLLFLYNKAPVLDAPSPASMEYSKQLLNSKFGVQPTEKSVVEKLKEIKEEKEGKKFKKRKPKQPNPLSCKKKQKKPNMHQVSNKKIEKSDEPKKKRKKIRIPQHVKEELLKSANVS